MADGNSTKLDPTTPGNDVNCSGRSFLDAAELVYVQQCGRTGFLDIPHWYVIHHLSCIAVELFLKSIGATFTPELIADVNGDYEDVFLNFEKAYKDHNKILEWLDKDDVEALRSFLTEQEFDLVSRFNTSMFIWGRYPFDGERMDRPFPSGDEGRDICEKMLGLARKLSAYDGVC